MRFIQPPRSRAYRTVVEQVCDAILAGELREGDMLPPEREIAAQLGISRSSVREAMRVLEDAHLVKRRPGAGRGTTVTSESIPVELLGQAMELSHRRIADMLEVRAVLEIMAAELAAARASEQQVEQLERVLIQARRAIERGPEATDLFEVLDPRFHLTLARAAQNQVLFETCQSFTKEVAVAVDMVPLGDEFYSSEVSSMAAIVGAVKSRDPTRARHAMVVHVSYLPPLVDCYFEGSDA